MKFTASFVICFILFLTIACRQKQRQFYHEFNGTYIEQPELPGEPAILMIRQIESRLYMIQLDDVKTVVVARDGMLSGVFDVPMKGEFPFNFQPTKDQKGGLLRIKNKTIRFRKTVG